MKKPAWIVEKERRDKSERDSPVWLFGLHAVEEALENPRRKRRRLIVTRNAADKLKASIARAGIEPEIVDSRQFPAPIDPASVHQGAAIEVLPLEWGELVEVCLRPGPGAPRVVLLDRVTDPHNVGAILRSAEVFGAAAVVAPRHHSAPETGALAKSASGALERQPYLRVRNLSDAIRQLQETGFFVLGLDGQAEKTIEQALEGQHSRAIALVLGAEGPGLRQKTRESCDALVRISFASDFGSLNVSNAAAVALYAARTHQPAL